MKRSAEGARMKIKGIVVLIMALIAVAGCAAVGVASDQEAAQVAKAVFDQKFKKCGESYYEGYGNIGTIGSSATELKGPITLTVQREALSEADRLNGFEWRGRVELRFAAYRLGYWLKPPLMSRWEWEGWRPWPDPAGGLELFEKKGGRWNSPKNPWGHFGGAFAPAATIDCASIPR
jgi:hypothetical protein